MKEAFDLAIIGGGSAGLTAAGLAVRFGARVALIEKRRLGGDCTWSGCVPSKTLLKVAHVVQEMRTADRFGLTPTHPTVDLRAVMAHVATVIDEVYQHEDPEALRAQGMAVFLDPARFLDSQTLQVGDGQITARRVLIATGARPFIPSIPGLNEVGYLTYEQVWQMQELPGRLLVLGGGPIGCEMAQAFGRLGSEVTLLEGGSRLLPRDEPAASRVLADALSAEGVKLALDTWVERVGQSGAPLGAGTSGAGGAIRVVAGGEEMEADALLVAVGRRADIGDLGLDAAGVRHSAAGIEVDGNLRTSQRHIYAAGDCTGGPQFTHYAGWQAAMAVRNALLAGSTRGVSDSVPWTTFTDPEVAHVGLLEEEARHRLGDGVEVCDWPMADVDRARAEGDTRGFIKLVHRRSGELLGVTIVSARAGEMIHEWVVAMKCGLKVGDVATAIHVYPTYSTAGMQAAADVRISNLMSGVSGKVIRGLVRLMR